MFPALRDLEGPQHLGLGSVLSGSALQSTLPVGLPTALHPGSRPGDRPCGLPWEMAAVGRSDPRLPVGPASFSLLMGGQTCSSGKAEVCVGAGGVGGGGEEGTTVKNVNLLITEYIAVHLKCCCHANTLGVYFLNPREASQPPAPLLCHLKLLPPPWYLF